MAKHVIVIASGETERRALLKLVSHLRDQDIFVTDVRIQPRNRRPDVGMAERLIKAAWYEKAASDTPPDKFVLLVDTADATSNEALAQFETRLSGRLNEIRASLQFAFAQRHLEAWYFGEASNLRKFLGGRALGNIDTTRPDEIRNPKNHLRNLLPHRLYTAQISEAISDSLDAPIIAERSPSFRHFLEAVRNGPSSRDSG